jgi:hypothetical protein
MSSRRTLKEGDRHATFKVFSAILAIILVTPWTVYVAGAQTDIAFTVSDKFRIPGTSSPSTISFSINGTYTQASIENGAWKFVGLSFRNSTQQGKLNLTVSAQDSNLTITSYRASTASNTTMGNVRINYIVEGNGTQAFNFGTIPKGGYWNVIFHRVYIGQHEGWDVSPDGTVTVTGAASGMDVNIVYYTFPVSFVDASSQPIYVQHSVILVTGVGVFAVVALCLAIWRKNLKHTAKSISDT